MPALPFFPISDRVVVNLKQIKFFRKPEDFKGWEVFFDRADEQPMKISDEQYEEIIEALGESEVSRRSEPRTVRLVMD